MKKILAILLASMMLLSLLPAAVAESAEEPVVITAMWENGRPQNAYTDEIHDYILKTLNIDLQLICVSENFTQQLALTIASGDIPDLILMEYRTYVEYANEGLFTDLTGLVDQYSDLMDYVNTGDQGEMCWNRMKVDGAIYGIPTRSVNTSMLTTAIRQDWLDNLGLQVPATIDELTEVLRAFTEDDPDQNGLNDTYGLSTYGMHNIYSMNYLSTIFGAFGAAPGQQYLLNDDGTVTTNVISDEYKAAVSYLHDIYAAGYMDPEIFTNSNSQAYEKFATGKMGFWPCWWSNPGSVYVKYGFLDNCPTGKITLVDPIVGPDGKSGLIGGYLHSNGKLAVLVEMQTGSDAAAASEAFHEVAKNVAMQIAAASPLAVSAEGLNPEVVEHEREVYRQKAREEGKPEQIIEKIAEGAVKKFCKDVCLLDQLYIRDDKMTISDLIKGAAKTIGEPITVVRFVRIQLGAE